MPDTPDFAALIEPVARKLLGDPNREYSTRNQLRFGSRGSMAVDIAGPKAGTWYSHEASVGGGTLDLIAHCTGLSNGAAVDWLRTEVGADIDQREPRPEPAPKTKKPFKIAATYDYHDAAGDLLFQVVRLEPKDFRQRRPDPSKRDGWSWSVKGLALVPFHLPALIAAVQAGHRVYVTEGEKDVLALEAAGRVATCNPGGAGKWRTEYADHLTGADVVVLPDNDDPGRAHADDVVALLIGRAASVRVLHLPDLPEKGDVADWFAAGNTADDLDALADAARVAEQTEAPEAPEPETGTKFFRVTDRGVQKFTQRTDKELGVVTEWKWFCSPLVIEAETRNASGEEWGRLLRIQDRDGVWKSWSMPMGMMAGDGTAYRERLLSLGLILGPGRFARDALHEYIATARPKDRARCVTTGGWAGDVFVLPRANIGGTNDA